MQKNEICDSELISKIRDGEEAAFRIVFDKYSARLYNFSFRFLKNKEQCQEVVQEAFLSFWLNRAKLDESYPVAPFLYTITRRLTLNSLRKTANSETAINKLWVNMQKVSNETEEVVLLD
ncbi:sigma factor, partial [Daejeonella sp.]|uniref:RNA polymerase sigma factor n=1 Tax=Daejeonella sp. TaxID=2805397 RepID=UPI0030C4FB8F